MVEYYSASRKLFIILNYTALTALALLCILPIINVLAVSFSESYYVSANLVKLWPKGFTFRSYHFVAETPEFLRSVLVALERLALGSAVNMLLTIIVAFPLSKESSQFRFRTGYVWLFVFTILFSGGLVPTYIIIKDVHLLDSIWSLVLPGAVPVFNMILLLNFFRSLPKEMTEAAHIDGATHWQVLWSIAVPLSKPALATIGLFTMVGHWNEWFNGLIYMNKPEHYPLASYLQTVIVQRDIALTTDPVMLQQLAGLNNRSVKAAQIFLGALPIFLVYPFLQRYFMSGIVLGSVKE
ncbi:carbohydrate ABC transporter permease [Paenibacillus lycopersici]|uniref:Carbohydrate ABC transporter permease n=1 Tax=Paenibacillus lycopersici TaxID=2704462 RepID=A0A6C0FVA7_9BACL|nr:carbohydrate ABC transporter permease [Paenibacillus lycopersici]QHT59972.1 carbohydrate ABC transporter permease [Paenibacillus lycopersici]